MARLIFALDSLPRRYALLALVWSALTGGSLAWSLYHENQSTLKLAAVATHANIQKDIGFRNWVNSHGGVYVSPTAHTPPNPYLDVPDRDVITTTGKKLTLMNPAYVLRQLQAEFPDEYGTKSRITSLHPLNPANAPDAWETRALKSFEQGKKEFLEVQEIDGRAYLRMMEPFIVNEGCMKCHAHQGYKIGDVRGGIGSSVALDRFYAHQRKHAASLTLSYGVIWLAVLLLLGIFFRRDQRRAIERQLAQEKLHQQLDELLRFQKLTVGRELRMKELADENAALHNQLAAAQRGDPQP
jgi:hypothetical protein